MRGHQRLCLAAALAACAAVDAAGLVGRPAPGLPLVDARSDRPLPGLETLRGRVVWIEFLPTDRFFAPAALAVVEDRLRAAGDPALRAIAVIARGAANLKEDLARRRVACALGWDSTGAAAAAYGVARPPCAFLIGPEGKVVWRSATLAEVDQRIRIALAHVRRAYYLNDGRRIVGRRIGALKDVVLVRAADGRIVRIRRGEITREEAAPPAPGADEKIIQRLADMDARLERERRYRTTIRRRVPKPPRPKPTRKTPRP